MRTVYKFSIGLQGFVRVLLEPEAKVLTVGTQGKGICLWIELDPDNPAKQERGFHVFGTGMPIVDADLEFVGSCFIGSFVWHVYQDPPKSPH